jgi:hypothetical protein
MPGIPDCADGPDLIQQWQASMGHIHAAPIVWKAADNRTWLFVMGEGDRLKAFPFEGGKFNVAAMKQGGWIQPTLKQASLCQSPPGNHGMWMPGGQLAVSNNGTTPGTGIIRTLVPANGDANSCRGVKAMLIAVNADDVTKELWRSQGPSPGVADSKDSVGLLARFNPPMIANGKVFVGTAGDAETLQRYGGTRPAPGPPNYYLAVYGLK